MLDNFSRFSPYLYVFLIQKQQQNQGKKNVQSLLTYKSLFYVLFFSTLSTFYLIIFKYLKFLFNLIIIIIIIVIIVIIIFIVIIVI